jgi:hypothetical protein
MNDAERNALAGLVAKWRAEPDPALIMRAETFQICADELEAALREPAASLPTLEEVARAIATGDKRRIYAGYEESVILGKIEAAWPLYMDEAKAVMELFQPAAEATPHRGCGCVYRGKHIAWNVDACPQHKRCVACGFTSDEHGAGTENHLHAFVAQHNRGINGLQQACRHEWSGDTCLICTYKMCELFPVPPGTAAPAEAMGDDLL